MVNKRRVFAIIFVFVVVITVFLVRYNFFSDIRDSLAEEYFAMDTVMDITLYETADTDTTLREVMGEVRERIYQLERELSVTDSKSDVSKLNQASGNGEWIEVSEDTRKLLEDAKRIAEETDSAFDPTLYPVIKLWGFTTGEYRVPSEEEIQKELKKTGIDKIEIEPGENNNKVRLKDGAQIDLGGCAKGFLSDSLSDILKTHHVNGLLSLGGNVQTVGTKLEGKPYVVGIADPANPDEIFTKIQTHDEAVITSGSYQRYFDQDGKRYHHIFDKNTGAPADNDLTSVTVIGKQGVDCDAYATAFFVMGEEAAKKFLKTKEPDYKVIFIRKDGSSWQSESIIIEK